MYSAAQVILIIEVCGIFFSSVILLFLQTSGDKDNKLNRLFTRLIICNIVAMSLSLINRFLIGIMPEFIARSIYFAIIFFALFCYGGIQMRQAKLLRDKEIELADSRTAIMLSQIQPHFLYNTLASIEYLCERGEAKEAGTAIRDFSKYLRGNMDSLIYKEPIPFEKELEHVMLYLLLEKKRFEERLAVTIEIGVTDFTIPALTLQPIVENAVNHGVTKRDEGGKITIKTDEDDDSWIVTVTDDGVGFDIDGQQENEISHLSSLKGTVWGVAGDGRTYELHSHVGIANVRSRLDAMCAGTLEIDSTSGKGTIATIKIPKDYRRN